MKRSGQAGLFLLCMIIYYPCAAELSDTKTFTLQGRVIASPCMVEQPTINVNLGNDIKMSDLATAGAFSDWVAFDIRIYNCPIQYTLATITFNGTSDSTDPDFRYQNSGTATNVAVELRATDGTPLGNGKSMTGIIANQEFTWNLHTRIWTETGYVRPGTVSAVVSATLTYQ